MASAVVERRKFRRWLGSQFGEDAAGGDRIARRFTHGLGSLILIYYLLPVGVFLVVSKEVVLVAAVGAALVLEASRLVVGFDLPMIRPHEEKRVASYAFYAVALGLAVLLFPLPIAAAVVLGTALVDPIIGELRVHPSVRRLYPALPFVVYVALACVGLSWIGAWPLLWAVPLALLAAALAMLVEWPKVLWIDDDLTMTIVPALGLYGVGVLALGLPK
jgi:hypothetical protein